MTIREWIQNPSSYDEGIRLYEEFGNSSNLKRLLRKGGDTQRNRETLIYELGKLAGRDDLASSPLVSIPAVVSTAGEIVYYPEEDIKPIVEEPNHLIIEQPPVTNIDEVEKLERKWRELYKICNHKKSQLNLMMDPEQRRIDALDILDIFDKQIHPIWEKLDFYKQHGYLPPGEIVQAKALDPLSLAKRRTNLKTYISKAKKGNKYLKVEDIPAWEAEIEKIEESLATLKSHA